MNRENVEQAALNNAYWCDAICRSHGVPGEFCDGAWGNRRPSPPFYPNVVTLGGPELGALHLQCIRDLLDAPLPVGWGVKDSFGALRLAEWGFEALLEAQWLYKPAVATVAPANWEIITTAVALDEWESAWSRDTGVRGIFLAPLLDDEDVVIMAARLEGQIIAGGIVNRAAGCGGLSNTFFEEQEAQRLREECVAMAQTIFPELPLVGWCRAGGELEAMCRCGFQNIGGLKVWLHTGEVA